MNSKPTRRILWTAALTATIGCGAETTSPGSGAATQSLAVTNTPVTGAAFTTTNPDVDGPGHCRNGNEAVNCNIYDDKDHVWLSGGPLGAALGDGLYFFAVVAPGGQGGNNDPNDGTPKNLSDEAPTTNTGAGDPYTHRVFRLVDGVIEYPVDGGDGDHDFANNKIRLMPYDDTPNPGGEYVLAICALGEGPPVDPSACKYDAFKIARAQGLEVTVSDPLDYDTTFAWTITKAVSTPLVRQASPTALLDYVVTVAHDEGTTSNWLLTGSITLGSGYEVDVETLVTVTVSTGQWTCTPSSIPVTVPANGATTLSYSCTYDEEGTPPAGFVVATVNWTFDGADYEISASDPLDIAGATADLIDDCIDVDDDQVGFLGQVCAGSNANPTFFTYTREVTGAAGTCVDFDNTATATTNDSGSTASASASAAVCVGADLVVAKDAEPWFVRTYEWNIEKSVDPTLVKQVGGTATLGYTVEVEETGFVDSDWAIFGAITVQNPNDWQDVDVTVTDVPDTLSTCTFYDVVFPLTLAAGGSIALDYACAFANGASGTNTATATWDGDASFTPNSSASGTAGYAFVTPTTQVHGIIDVIDTFAGELGSVTATDDAPYARATYTYERTVELPQFDCIVVDNTATITTTGQSADASATLCGPKKTGARTIGFWRNRNGQGILTAGSSTGGVCAVGTWLREYQPYLDLAATASCTQVALYVTNLINAASAAGPTMNAMLKAQMLATALDVYFSDPALGGNRIGAPAPVGGVLVDLTLVCTDLGCAAYADASSVFGGSPKTVLEMLEAAGAASDAGGTLWYGNVKSTQELAKDAFDAVNNEKLFAP
jgi:hypothetical protein